MKKGFYFLFILTVMAFLPLNVFGLEADFSVICPDSAKKGETITCTVKADITAALEEEAKLASVTGTLDGGTKLTVGETFTKTGLELTGDAQTVGTIEVVVKDTATAVGDAILSLTITSVKDSLTNNVTYTPTTALTKTIKIKSSDTSLSSIKIDGTESSCTLSSNACNLPTVAKKTILIAATPTSNKATVTGVGSKTLVCGANTIKLTTTAEDGTKADYSLSVSRTCNTDTTLKAITLSAGTLNPTFAAGTKVYTVDVTSSVDKITVAATPNNATQTVTGTEKNKKLEYGANKFNLSVKSESGETATYTVTVNRADDRDTDNTLKSIELSDGKLVFDPTKTEYEVKVLSTVEKMTVTATTTSEKATVKITNNDQKLKEGVNPSIIITTKSEKGEEKIYKITVTKLKEGETLGDNPNLTSLKITGYDLAFNPSIDNYTLKIDNEEKLDIKYEVEELGTNVTIAGNDSLKDGDVIVVTSVSQDGTQTKEYKIVIEKSNSLIFIIIAGVVGLGAIGGIAFLLIKNKKDKKDLLVGDITIAKDENIVNQMPKRDEKITLNNFGPTTPVSINQGLNEVKENNVFNSYREEPVTPTPVVLPTNEKKADESLTVDTNNDATRVCSICGHRVSASLKTCPYCKRSF